MNPVIRNLFCADALIEKTNDIDTINIKLSILFMFIKHLGF